MRPIQKKAGFTLIELLVAMAIFSLMTAIAYAGISSVMLSDKASLEHETDLKKLQRAFVFIEKDLRQLSLRQRNDGYSALQPPLKADGAGNDLIEFSRSGNPNPTSIDRSSLQRIRYVVEDETLLRLSWNLIDHTDAEPITMALMKGVSSVKVSFFSADGETTESWVKPTLPLGIEIRLTVERWGEIRRVLPIYY